ncbi:maleylacetate reductase [Sinirhodobacter populi]|uniref:Maleylacetate reductase n=1 Tax=Paenirhodobacter populi TaxID=2306993 RepID=A0A443KNU2_9RHOB|nr:maleylacetate reductase [Sinirhodobacter populi]RWR34574.1 maleylacetate reductase [Sinirhodobacter populi]
MRDFVYNAHPGRVIFGRGTLARLPEEIGRLGLKKVLLLATPQQVESVAHLADLIGDQSAGIFAGARMHTPTEVTKQALDQLRESGADGVVALGGGSTIGLGKALAFRTDVPQIVIPTTYAGSEMTPILGETADGLKRTQSSPKILPETVIYDVDLTMTLPARMSGVSGMNAIAHAVEAMYAKDANPIITLMAAEAIAALSGALPAIARDPQDAQARSKALYGAWLCGTCLGAVGMSLHHKLCHTLGGSFDLPHAETHTIVLPHALAYNGPAIPDVIERLRVVLKTDDPARRLYEIAQEIGAPRSLKEIGMPREGIARAVELAMSNAYWNPRPLEASPLTGLITRAWEGEAPHS